MDNGIKDAFKKIKKFFRFRCIQQLIDILRGKERLHYITVFAKKIKGINIYNDIETLILGSSSMEGGYIAQEKEYNFAIPAFDLYYIREMFKKYDNEKIKNIVFNFSYFSPWSVTVKGNFAYFCTYLKHYLGFEYQFKDVAEKKELDKLVEKNKKYMDKIFQKVVIEPDYRGNFANWRNKYTPPTEEHKQIVLKAMQREHIQMEVFKKFLEDTKRKNLFIVIPPTTEDFRSYMPDKNEIFKELFDIVKDYPHAKVLDYYDCEEFTQERDFHDQTHVNYVGALKLTEKIRKAIQEQS